MTHTPPAGQEPAETHPPPAERRRASISRDLREIAATELWGYRELALQLTLRDIRLRYKQAVMGLGWAVLMPLLIVAAGSLVRLAVARVGGESIATLDLARMAVKAIPWAFFVGAVGFATTSLTANTPLVQKVYFPRELLPVSATLAQAFDALVGASVLFVVLLALGIVPTLSWLWLVPLVVFLVAFTLGLALLVGCANLFFRDVKYLVQVLLTFGIFFTPVFFEPQMLGAAGTWLMMLNPLAPMLEGIRLAAVEGHHLHHGLGLPSAGDTLLVWSPWYLAYAAFTSVLTLLVGALVFHRFEPILAEYA